MTLEEGRGLRVVPIPQVVVEGGRHGDWARELRHEGRKRFVDDDEGVGKVMDRAGADGRLVRQAQPVVDGLW